MFVDAMGEHIAKFDWQRTELGALPLWQASLRIAVDTMLLSPFPSAVVWGPGMTVVHNDAYLPLLNGIQHGLGRGFDTLWGSMWPELGPWVFKALQGQASFVQDEPQRIECATTGVSGWFRFSYTPIRDEHHDVVGFLHTAIETSASEHVLDQWREQTMAFERQIKRYMDDLEYMWQLSRDAMVTVTRDLRLQSANPAWYRILGWREDQVRDMPVLQLIHPADRAEVEVAVTKFVGERITDVFETRMRHADGHYRCFRWTAKFDGALLTAVGRDITDDREEAMRQSRALIRDTQRLEMVGQLAGGMAHEMNNLLSGVGGSLELLQRRLAEGRLDRIDSYVELARDTVNRAMTLTHRLLAFSRHQPLSPKPLNINHQLSLMEPLLLQALGAEMHLAWEMDVSPWAVCLDVTQLESSLINLCANARDACLERGTVMIRTMNTRLAAPFPDEKGLPPGDYVALQVEDDGHGMPADYLNRAFEPFFTTKAVGRGSGLGLPMVHGFVRQSGGYIWIDSTPDQGAKVCMLFPRISMPVAEEPVVCLPRVTEATGQRLLLVDDEHGLRGLIVEYLRERGFNAYEATDSTSALERFRNEGPFDLVITDVGLPGGFSGRQLVKTMRMIKPEQKVLFITGYTDFSLDAHQLQGADTALLLKPFQLETLANQILLMLTE
ncbi:ATP-binding protein [Pseudomonas sp. PSKL.D1]|uniref:ATP-binding protein n=1 Tax=Pseudomonas sp. PSKL.D1 TaxID=3029060 RepID=UPI0023811E84|nr:ATP-binding protein [Pseudomonas sp. PSKL.D1]WDY60140.1 ATP-binding protein [Pseudomonas sp. PSKL.D1]